MGWTLTGGAALAGYHLGHRETRDLDLFWHGRNTLDAVPGEVERRLHEAGLAVHGLQTAPGFRRYSVTDGREALPLDLVAEPVPFVDPPSEREPGILVESAQEILANKLGALLSRWAVRDLVDVRALLEAGFDLERAVAVASRKDGGFSPATLAWVLSTTPEVELDDGLRTFREELIRRLLD